MKKTISLLLVLLILASQMSFVFAYGDDDYYVQVGAFESKVNAEKYTNYIIGIGYNAVTIKVFDLYKVFLGPYETEEQARLIADDYKSIGGSGFFIAERDMYYQPPVIEENTPVEDATEEVVEETTEEVAEETTEEVAEETTEEVAEETTEEVAEETTEEAVEETTDEIVEETTDEIVEETTDDVKVITSEVEDEPDYKLFTIILIVMLWVIFIIILVVFRLNQNKRTTN